MKKEIDLRNLRERVLGDNFSFLVEEQTSEYQARYKIVRGIDRWLVSVFCKTRYRTLGYFLDDLKLILGKYSRFKLSDVRVQLFQHVLDNLDSVPLFLKVYE